MYIEISEMFKNHITVIEKNDIAIHIDIELLSSPNSDGLTCFVSFESAVLNESFDMNDSVSNSVLSILMFLDIFLMVI